MYHAGWRYRTAMFSEARSWMHVRISGSKASSPWMAPYILPGADHGDLFCLQSTLWLAKLFKLPNDSGRRKSM